MLPPGPSVTSGARINNRLRSSIRRVSKSMQTHIEKLRDGLVIWLPQSMVDLTGFQEDMTVDLTVREGEVVIKPATNAHNRLMSLVDQITDENRHEEADLGPTAGAEEW